MTVQVMKKKEFELEIAISMLISVIATYFLPTTVNVILGKNKFTVPLVVLFMMFCIGVVCLLAFLSKNLQDKGKKAKTYINLVGRVLLMFLILFCVTMFFSLLSGLVAVFLYAALKGVLALGQIKGIINLFTTGIMFLTTPFFIVMFWKTLAKQDKLTKVVKESLQIKGKSYVKFLILTVILFAVGVVVMIPFNFLPNSIFTIVIETIVLGSIGTIALEVSRCMVI